MTDALCWRASSGRDRNRAPRPDTRVSTGSHPGKRAGPARSTGTSAGDRVRSPVQRRSHEQLAGRLRDADEIALREVAAEVGEQLQGGPVLDSLGDDAQTQSVSELDGAAYQ